jgi:hypothetical protein
MERVIPLVMPEKEAKSRAVLVLVREIVACAVLHPVMKLLADPDVWNQLIEHMVILLLSLLISGCFRYSRPSQGQEVPSRLVETA